MRTTTYAIEIILWRIDADLNENEATIPPHRPVRHALMAHYNGGWAESKARHVYQKLDDLMMTTPSAPDGGM